MEEFKNHSRISLKLKKNMIKSLERFSKVIVGKVFAEISEAKHKDFLSESFKGFIEKNLEKYLQGF